MPTNIRGRGANRYTASDVVRNLQHTRSSVLAKCCYNIIYREPQVAIGRTSDSSSHAAAEGCGGRMRTVRRLPSGKCREGCVAHVLVVGACAGSLTIFRGELMRCLIASGHRVTAMAADATDEQIEAVRKVGAEFRAYPVHRSRISLLTDLHTFFALRSIFRELKPDVILAYTIKPVIWGGLASRRIRQARFYALVTGLGFAFSGTSASRRALTMLVTRLYRNSLKLSSGVVFQNTDNREEFVGRKIAPREHCHVVNGSGVDLARFTEQPVPDGDIVFLMIARLLQEKGVREYSAAAKIVRERYPEAKFHLVGPEDPSPDRIPLREVREWQQQGRIEYLGTTEDVRPLLNACHVYVLPSYHEGMPRTVLEAMAVGRPVLTTDAPGCRDTVISGENGFLVPVADADALAERMIWFIENRGQLSRMGQLSRKLAEKRYDVHQVNRELLAIMGLGSNEPV